jgi:hypothetical protein
MAVLPVKPRRLGGLALLLTSGVLLFLAQPPAGDGQPPGDVKTPPHRVVRVSDKDAKGAVEVSVAINPTNPDHIIAVSIARMKAHPGVTNFAYVTSDAGKTWKTVPRANPLKRTQGDDVVTFTADGLAIHTFIAFEGIRVARPPRASSGIITTTSRDGLTWTDPVPIIDHINSCEPHEDKPWMKADISKDSPHRGNLYVAWSKFDVYGSKDPEHKTHVYFSRSLNAGKTFSVPWRISDKPGDAVDSSNTVMGAVPAVGPKGEVYVVWGGPEGIYFTQSSDAGKTFSKNKVLTKTPGGWDFPIKGIGRADGLPSMGVDISPGKDRGSIYVNWADLRHGDPDSFVIVSRDGGATWSELLRVNDDPKGNGKEQFFTWLVVDPVDGAVNIVFYDRRDYDGTKTGLTLARSVDGGRTFVNHKINQEPFSCDNPKLFFGDYLGLDAYGGRVVAAYMHYLDAKSVAISAAIFDFEPGTQKSRVEKK